MRRPSVSLPALVLASVLGAAAAGAARADDAAWLRDPAISPDATRIAFTYRGDVWTVPAAGGRAVPLTTHDAVDTAPVWSPDGRTIAFTVITSAGTRIDLVRPDGSDRRRLDDSVVGESLPAWSPDGRSIAFERDSDIVVRTLATGAEAVVALDARTPVFSPDGTRLLFEADRQIAPGVFRIGVWMHRFDADVPDVLLAGDGAGSPAWQPLCSIKGTSGPDTLNGTAKAELICGRGGRDTIDGKGGLDIVLGGPGDDVLKGGAANDVLVGADGNDRFDGGLGSDLCVQGPGSGTKTSCER